MWNQQISRRSFLSITAMAATAALDWTRINALAGKMGPKADYPGVVIGAGLGGLCCGALLARQGIPVTVLEKHDIPGGYATAFDRGGGKFRFEVSLEGTAIKARPSGRMLENLGIRDKLQWVALPDVFRVKAGNRELLFPQRNPEAFIKELGAQFPQEAEGIRGFVQNVLDICEENHAYGAAGPTY